MELEGSLVDVGASTKEVCSVNKSELTVRSIVMSVRASSGFICGSKSVLVAVSIYTALYLFLTLSIL